MSRSGRSRRRLGVLALVVLAVACGGEGQDGTSTSGIASADNWTLTVYYTAVEEHHDGSPVPVTGCPELDCLHGDTDLGAYPADFVEAVEAEGTGRITSGPHADEYLNWSYDVGYWLDTAPRDTDGNPLEPWHSAAADPEVLAADTTFRVTDCGELEEGGTLPADVCQQLLDAEWVIVDEFTPGLGGEGHLDLYIGEETGPTFTDSDVYTTLVGARLTVDRPEE